MKKRVAVAGLAAALSGTLFMQTAFAQEMINNIIKSINLGHIQVEQTEASDEAVPVPDTLKGKLFTKDGNEIAEVTKDTTEFYTKEGKKIVEMDAETGEIAVEGQQIKQDSDDDILIERDINKLDNYTCFKVQLPQYLPEGYTFDRAEFYKDETDKVENSKYISLYFTNAENNKQLYIQERFADEETAYEVGTDGKIEEVTINGVKAVLQDDKNLDWEKDGTLFTYHTRNNISRDELIKSAESIK